MHIILTIFSACLLFPSPAFPRRTAPRRTTASGGTYGTNTFAPVTGSTTEEETSVATTTERSTTTTVNSNFNPIQVFAPVTSKPRDAPVVTLAPMLTTPDQEYEEGSATNNDDALKPKIFGASLCEEVEELLQPGSTEEECFTGEPVRLRYWQPWRALRNIRCKSIGNDTTSKSTQRCALSYPGAQCVQKYQEFVILAAMGPAASGWSCVRLASGCSCSVRSPARLRKTEYEQRSDLRDFLKE